MWEHYRVLREAVPLPQPFPSISPVPDLIETRFTDSEAAGGLLFYEVRTADCNGNLSPDPWPPDEP